MGMYDILDLLKKYKGRSFTYKDLARMTRVNNTTVSRSCRNLASLSGVVLTRNHKAGNTIKWVGGSK